MATIDAGPARRGRRASNHELPLVPFIDFLICLVVFLLAQVGFANFARLRGSASVPGKSSDAPSALSKRLHLDVQEQRFRLTWQSGAQVLASSDVPLRAVIEGRGVKRYPELAQFLVQDWQANGAHREPSDPDRDEAVLHVRNSAPYEDVIAVLDALHAPERAFTLPGGGEQRGAAFSVSFAAD